MSDKEIPFGQLQTIFLDAGNTLVSMDFIWLKRELEKLGVSCKIGDLCRAESAARPVLSGEIERLKSTENSETALFYIKNILKGLSATSYMVDEKIVILAEALMNIIKKPENSLKLWTYILPGVPEALDILIGKGLQLVVVSNSDGTVEEILTRLNLRPYFEHVVDSHLAGFEKPDPKLFYHALEISNADPERTLHVGDIYHVDITGARAAYLHAVLLDPFGDWNGIDCFRFPDLLSLARKICDYH